MSKGLVDNADKLQWRKMDELKNEFGVDFHPATVSASLTCSPQR
jgi:hypothetical protein